LLKGVGILPRRRGSGSTGADGEIRTLTDDDLNVAPLPVGLRRPGGSGHTGYGGSPASGATATLGSAVVPRSPHAPPRPSRPRRHHRRVRRSPAGRRLPTAAEGADRLPRHPGGPEL